MNSEPAASRSFLTDLVQRSLDAPFALRPRLASPFEPPPAPVLETAADDDARSLGHDGARMPTPAELEARLDVILTMPAPSAGAREQGREAPSRITDRRDRSDPVEVSGPPPLPLQPARSDPLDVRREAGATSSRVAEARQPQHALDDSDRPWIVPVPTTMPPAFQLAEASAPTGPAVHALGRVPRGERPQPPSRAETPVPAEHRGLEPAARTRAIVDPARRERTEFSAQAMPRPMADPAGHDFAAPPASLRPPRPRGLREEAEGGERPITSSLAASRPWRSPKENSLLARLPDGQPALPGPTTPRRASESPGTAPTIQVTIGRVEVRAIPAAAAGRRPEATKPALSLDEYLRQRGETRR